MGKEGLPRKVRGLAPDQGGQALGVCSFLQSSVPTQTVLFLECLFRQVRWPSGQNTLGLLACPLVSTGMPCTHVGVCMSVHTREHT